MLDVHPPHEAAHSWKDFFIHIATIVVGLLIAVSLEQTVEYAHHRQQLAEVRRDLATEYKIHLAVFKAQRKDVNHMVPILKRDMMILQFLREHPHAPPETWPGELGFYYLSPSFVDAFWKSLQNTPSLNLLPREELQRETELYTRMEEIDDALTNISTAVFRTIGFSTRDPNPANMTTAQLDETIHSLMEVLMDYSFAVNRQIELHKDFPEFEPAPTLADQRRILPFKSPDVDVAAAQAIEREMNADIRRIQVDDAKK